MIRTTRAAMVVVGLAVASSHEPSAHASDVRECLSAHAAAQVRRRAGKLREARKLLLACSADGCPAEVRKDCGAWLGDVDQALPSIVIVTRNGDAPTLRRIVADGEPIAERVNGLAIPLDPGPHALRFECANGTIEEARVQLVEGEKRRRVDVSCEGATRDEPAHAADTDESGKVDLHVPVATFVLGGVALAGAASFATFAIVGRANEASLAERCGGHCAQRDVAPVRTKYAIADVSLGVGVLAAAGAALVFALSRGGATARRAPLGVASSPSGAAIMTGQF